MSDPIPKHGGGIEWIRRGDIPEYFNETFLTGYKCWKEFKTFGIPHGRGYINERLIWQTVVGIIEEEFNLAQNFDWKENKLEGFKKAK